MPNNNSICIQYKNVQKLWQVKWTDPQNSGLSVIGKTLLDLAFGMEFGT